MDPRLEALTPDRVRRLCEFARNVGLHSTGGGIPENLVVPTADLFSAPRCTIQVVPSRGVSPLTLSRRAGGQPEAVARKIDQVLVGAVLRDQRTIRVADLSADSRFPFLAGSDAARFSAIATPVGGDGEPIGVFIVGRPIEMPMTEADQTVADLAGEILDSPLRRAREMKLLSAENDRLRDQLAHRRGLRGLIGVSAGWHLVRERILVAAPSEARVLILGESGVGKELCARAIHELSPRASRPFVAVNCGALTETLAESELFGHTRGAFTGAMRDSPGLFVEADGGTLLLDEIGAAPPTVQSALLRAIQEGEVRPVGSPVSRKVDVRIVCSTSASLKEMMEEGGFRKDLYYRINAVTISLPPLRERREDIPALAHEFLSGEAARYNRTHLRAFTPEAMARMTAYSWPGNARELQNCVQHAVLFTPLGDAVIRVDALPAHIRALGGTPIGMDSGGPAAGLDRILEYHEREIIRTTLAECQGNQSQTARVLGVPEKRIRDRMKKYGLRGP